MAKIQIALKLNDLIEPELLAKGTEIATGLTTNAADFTGITPSAADIDAATTAAEDAVADAANKATIAGAAIIAKNNALLTLHAKLTAAAGWTENNLTDPETVAKVFPLRKTATPAPADLAQVLNLVLGFGSMAGRVNANWEKTPRAVSYEVQVRYRDIAGSPWATVKTLSATRFAIPGLTSGQIVQVRVRAIGPKSLEGDWSDLAEHMVP